jgi:ornithine cyclodeaminase/alanine dehydrogenase-like protein (mu-crystallin family)
VSLGTKLVTVYGRNGARGHPTVYASYVLMDGLTGEPRAMLEGTFLTALRTGATSALAARYLARRDSATVTCFGAGVQARFQLWCLASVLPLERVVVLGRDPARARRFAEQAQRELGIEVAVGRGRGDVREADVVVCATTSTEAIVSGVDLRPGTHVDAVGAFRATEREVDTEAVQRARVVVDTYAGALAEAGDILIPLGAGAIDRAHIAAELGEIVTGARPGRQDPEQITLFKSVGHAVEDLATARLAYNLARARGCGIEVTL